VAALRAPLAHLARGGEYAVHRADRAHARARAERRGVDLGGRLVDVGGRVEHRVRYSIDTQPGPSGAGFYEIDGERYVLGVHRGPTGSVNDGVRIDDGNRDVINDTKSDFPAHACD
jgi:hypothetical protein